MIFADFKCINWRQLLLCLILCLSTLTSGWAADVLQIHASADCVGAEMNEYMITISTVDGSTASSFTVTIDGVSKIFSGTPISFGAFAHSGIGGKTKTVLVTDGLGNTGSIEVAETLCGFPQSAPFCDCSLNDVNKGGSILAQAKPGTFDVTISNQVYVLTTTDNSIIGYNNTGLFSALDNGDYIVYALNYDKYESVLINSYLKVGDSINPLVNREGVLALACYTVCGHANYTVNCKKTTLNDQSVSLCFNNNSGQIANVNLTTYENLFGALGGKWYLDGVLVSNPTSTSVLATKNKYTYTVTDALTHCEYAATLTIQGDTTPPTINCKNITIQLDASGNASISTNQIVTSVSDNCSTTGGSAGLQIQLSKTTFSCQNVGDNAVTVTVTDQNGNVATCTATVTVRDSPVCRGVFVDGETPNRGNPRGNTGREDENSTICICKNNATTLENGQFEEHFLIIGFRNQFWRIKKVEGLYQANSPAPPNQPIPLSAGMRIFADTNDPTKYVLNAIHIDGVGFTLEIERIDSYTGEVIQTISGITNKCFYPNIAIVELPTELCPQSGAKELKGFVENNVAGTGYFTINGLKSTVFDPKLLGIGDYVVEYVFDAGTGYSFDAKDPGCTQSISQKVILRNLRHIWSNAVKKGENTLGFKATPLTHIVFPCDTMLTECASNIDNPSPSEVGDVQIRLQGCDFIGKKYEDKIFAQDGEACKKIFREWQVIDWSYFLTNGGNFKTEKVEDWVDFGENMPIDTLNKSSLEDYLGNEKLYYYETLAQTIADWGTFADGKPKFPSVLLHHYVMPKKVFNLYRKGLGYWTYTQIIKIKDNEKPSIINTWFEANDKNRTDNHCNATTICTYQDACGVGKISLGAEGIDACTKAENLSWRYTIQTPHNGKITGVGNKVDVVFPLKLEDGTIIQGFGEYQISWTVLDNCGNFMVCTYPFVIKDCEKPTPIAKLLLSTDIMPQAKMVTVQAIHFENNSYDNCTPNSRLKFFIARFKSDTLPNTTSLTFTCNDLGLQPLYFYVQDEAGNWDFTRINLLVGDNNKACGTEVNPLSIIGKVTTEKEDNIEQVAINLNNGDNTIQQITGTEGVFNFKNLLNSKVLVTPEKNIDPLNGVSTVDLVAISKHILGVEPLKSPYLMIAADVNRSGYISVSDIVELRKMILRINDNFSNNTSWRFIDKAFEFPDKTNPWLTPFPEYKQFSPLTQAERADFIGVKIGDMNGSAVANTEGINSRSAFKNDLTLLTNNYRFEEGDTLKVKIQAKSTSDIIGYQFTLGFDTEKLELLDVQKGVEDNESNIHFGLPKEGIITNSWYNIQQHLKDKQSMQTLVFKAKTKGELANHLRLEKNYTIAEAYNAADEIMGIKLVFDGSQALSTFELYQNRPNPFNDKTLIGFSLPKGGKATFSVFDMTGKLLKTLEKDFEKGYNELTVDKIDLQTTGIYFYRLESEFGTATRKMILID